MIVASRIPSLTERMRTATIEAAHAQRHTPVYEAGRAEIDRAPARRLVKQLERLGYRVMLEQVAA